MPQFALCSLPSALAVGVCAAGVLSACDVTIKDGDIKGVSVQAKVTREWNRHYPLAEGGRVEISQQRRIEAVVGPAGPSTRGGHQAAPDRVARERDLNEIKRGIAVQTIWWATARPSGRGGSTLRQGPLPAENPQMSGNKGPSRPDMRGPSRPYRNGGVELSGMTGTSRRGGQRSYLGEDGAGHRADAAREHERADYARDSQNREGHAQCAVRKRRYQRDRTEHPGRHRPAHPHARVAGERRRSGN